MTFEPNNIYLTKFSGAPLSISSTMSLLVSKPPEEMTIFDRLANIFSYYFFTGIFMQLPIAKFFYGQENPEFFKPVENTLLFSNNHKLIDWPIARTHGLIDIGNLEEEDPVLTEKIDTVEKSGGAKIGIFVIFSKILIFTQITL